ncbi:uncharacterized protein LOC113045408 isoform X1 [Carassius auratus]|uniref:Uncharacterized protein LOC113045408 isoform X1 n=1 Tax=Carassius auratus TaxID=7957 RepID=A0A6P6JP30_CARAU|nr:uncharacterized protein LOC113045408 isoform X1 [Carassius auratus]
MCFCLCSRKKNTLESSDDETDIEMKRQYEKAKRQKKVAKERILTQLKDTLRKPLHSTPCRTNPLHSEEEVEFETVDTNVDLFNYPGNSQSTDTLDAAEASGESVEQPLFVSGEVLKALKEISTVAFGILFLPHLRCVFTRITCGVHQEWSSTCIRIEPTNKGLMHNHHKTERQSRIIRNSHLSAVCQGTNILNEQRDRYSKHKLRVLQRSPRDDILVCFLENLPRRVNDKTDPSEMNTAEPESTHVCEPA